jgi:hypothetical protein
MPSTLGSHFYSQATGFVSNSTVAAVGDILVASAAGVVSKIPVGADGASLVCDSAELLGVKWSENPIRTSATVTTSDATVTTIMSLTTVTDSVEFLEFVIKGMVVGGSDVAAYIRRATIKNVAGVASVANFSSEYTYEDVPAWNCSVAVSGATVEIQVTGAAATNISWKAHLARYK